ncbi:hypothetical protein CR513_08581, partial [Mucuna pruriens]
MLQQNSLGHNANHVTIAHLENLGTMCIIVNSVNSGNWILDTEATDHDNNTLRMICVASSIAGLYIIHHQRVLPFLSYSVNNFHSYKCDTWHLRFGHSSHGNYENCFLLLNVINLLNLVRYVIWLNKRGCLFPIASLNLLILLIYCIWIFGVLSASLHCFDIDIFLLRLMLSLAIHGFFFMKLKSKTSSHIKQFNAKVKSIQFDNGKEFMLDEFYKSKGIVHQTSCVDGHTPTEREYRKEAPTYYGHGSCPFFSIQLPTMYLSNQLPYQKQDPQGRKCVHLGFKSGTKGYLLFDLHLQKYVSRDVPFYEQSIPFSTTPTLYLCHLLLTRTFLILGFTLLKPHLTIIVPFFHPLNLTSILNILLYDSLSHRHKTFTLNIYSILEPTTYNEAIQHDCWRAAIDVELTAPANNNTWTSSWKESYWLQMDFFKTKHKAHYCMPSLA